MTSTVYTDYTTPAINAAWLNDVDRSTYQRLFSISGSDTIIASGPATLVNYTNLAFEFVASNDNTGAVTINISGLGAVAITKNGATPLTSGDIVAGKVCRISFDGTAFQLLNAAGAGSEVLITPQQYGAIGDGIADDTAAFVATDAVGSSIYVPAGIYKITSTTTFSSPFTFAKGASLAIPTGVVITFNESITAPLTAIFSLVGTARIDFDLSKQLVGYPEWWGATSNSSLADCTAAINACIVACPITQLQDAQYYCLGTVQMTTNHRTIKGFKNYPYALLGADQCTQIVINSATERGMLVGSDTAGLGGATSTLDISVVDLAVVRGTAPTASGVIGAIGIDIRHCLFPTVENVMSMNHNTAFLISGNIQARLYRTYAGRDTAATNPGSDFWNGYYLDGASGLNAAGGNASTYMDLCQGGCGVPALTTAGSIGILIAGAGADTYLTGCEVGTCTEGLQLIGSQGGALNQSGDADILISKCVFDGFANWGIHVLNTANYAAIKISDCYCAPRGGGSFSACFGFSNCGTSTGGNISLTGNQAVGWPASGAALFIDDCFGIQSIGNMWNACTGGSSITNSSYCRLMDSYNNPAETATYAVYMDSCVRCYVGPVILGGTTIFSYGVLMNSTTNTYNEINCTGMSVDALVAGAGHKLLYNGATIAVVGTFGTGNYASGVIS